MNCCLQFLFLNFIAGVFIFIILGIFVITDNPFLILMNFKEIDGKKEYGDHEKKNAYIQYFTAAGFSLFFAFTIWFITTLKGLLGSSNNNKIKVKKNEMQIIKESDDKINIEDNNNIPEIIIKESNNNEINTNNTNNNIISSINTINTISTGKEIGMTEKTEY